MKYSHFKLILTILLCSWSIISHAQGEDPLQTYIDQLAQRQVTRSLVTPRSKATIDLSEYPDPRTETLHIHGYIEITFVNGTLRRDSTFLEAPLVVIEEDAALNIDESAAIATCTNRMAKASLIEVKKGELIVDGGSILGKMMQTDNNSVVSNNEQNMENKDGRRNIKVRTTWGEVIFMVPDPAAVELSSPTGCSFCLLSGRVDSDVKNILSDDQHSNINTIQINGGHLNGELQSMNDICLKGEAFVNYIDLKGSNSLVELLSSPTHIQTIKGVTLNVPAVMIANDDISVDPNMIWFIDDYRPESVMQTNENGKTLPYIIPREWGPVRTFNNNTAGQLAYISAANREITNEVVVSGELNGSDIQVLRQMGAKALKKLNMSQARIISGGDSYYSTSVYNGSIRPTIWLYYTENDTISVNMFANCIALEEVWLPQGIRVIEGNAFSGCTSLHSLHGLTDVYELSSASFSNCEALTNFDLTNNNHLTMSNGVIYTADFTTLLAALPGLIGESVEIPSSVSKTNDWVFANCQKITHIDWPKTLAKIPYGMFSGCKNLTEFSFPSTLITIESLAFSGCSLSCIHLPATLMEIGSGAFALTPLTNISCEATVPPHITEYYNEEWGTIDIPNILGGGSVPSRTFEGVNIGDVTLHLHKGCSKAYQDSQKRKAWLVFRNMIEDLTSDPLQALIDGLSETGTSENPVALPLPENGIVVVEEGDVEISGSLQLLISGAAWASYASSETNSPQPVIHMPGGNINVAPEASLTLQNVSLTASANNCRLKIRGMLVVDDNVKATQFKNLIELEEGSQLIWKSGVAEATESVIQNDGGDALFEEADIQGQIKNNGYIVVKAGNYDGGVASALTNTKGKVVIKGGKWTGGKGINNVNGNNSEDAQAENDQDHVIANHGNLSIEDGTFGTNGEGSIWTDSDIDINGQVELGSIYIQHGKKITLTGKMTNTYTIHIQHEGSEEIETGVIITGGNEYMITRDDVDKMAIELPEDYYSKYDEQNNAIVICSHQNDGVRDIKMNKNLWTDYDLLGRKLSHKNSGIIISKGRKVAYR